MILKKIRAKNFLSFRNLNLDFKDSRFITIVGPNNSGKTNFVRAVNFLKEACNSSRIEGNDYLHHGSSEFSLAFEVSLSEEEKEDLKSFLKVWLQVEFELAKNGVRNRSLKDIDWGEEKKVEEIVKKFLFEDFLEYLLRVLEQFTIVVRHNYGESSSHPTIEFNIAGQTFHLTHDGISIYPKGIPTSIIYCLKEFSKHKKPESLTSENLLKVVIQKNYGIEARFYYSAVQSPLTAEERHKFDKILDKYSFDIKSPPENLTLLSFFLSFFKTRILFLEEMRSHLQGEFDDGEYKKLRQRSTYSGKGYDLSVFLFSLKSEKFERFEEIKNYFQEITGIDFDVEEKWESDKWKVSLKFNSFNNKLSHHFVGSGLLEILNILAVCIGNRNAVIILDEPALHLHPTKQKQIIEKLFEFKEADQNQIFLITHSPYMVLKEVLPRTYYFSLRDGETKVTRLDLQMITQEAGEERIVKEFEFYPYREMFFANGVLFVEGESEAIGIPFILKELFEQKNILVFNVRSMKHFKIPIKVAESLGIPFIAVGDAKAEDSLKKLCPDSYFTLKQNDFVDFLKDCFPKAFQKIDKKGNKPETTIAVLSNADPEELEKAKQELEPLIRLMKEKFNG